MSDDQPSIVFVVATYEDVSAAEAGYQAVCDVYRGLDEMEQVDAVVLGKTVTGVARIYEGDVRPTTTNKMATGLAVALFPAAQIGSVTWTAVEGAVTGVLAGRIAAGMSRDDLNELGDRLDRCDAALIVAAAPDMENKMAGALSRAHSTVSHRARPDTAEIGRDIAAIRSADHAP